MRIALVVLGGCLVLASAAIGAGGQAAQPPAQPAPATPAPPPAGTPPAGVKPAAPRPSAARTSVTLLVTNMEGKPLPEVWVKATGPVDREAATDADGTVTFRNMSAGAYRLRFERDEYVTFEREITVAGRPLKATAALNAAPPPPPPPPAPTPEPSQPPPSAAPAGPPAQPTVMSLLTFIEKNYVGNKPLLQSVVGCAPTGTASLLQVRDPLAEHAHADGDEMLYVIAGNGSHRMSGSETPVSAGHYIVVPRGTTHSIARRGSNPIMLLSVLSGAPCK